MYYDKMDKEVEKKLDEYEKIFTEGFPLAPYNTSFWDNEDIDD